MRSWFNARAYVSFGLCGMTLSLLLAAGFFGLVPDRISALRESRATVAEVVAASSTALITAGDARGLEAVLALLVERNPDVSSVVVRRHDGVMVIGVGDVRDASPTGASAYSIEQHVKVPILAGEHRWGQLELGFKPLDGQGITGFLQHPWVKLFGAVFVGGFFAYYFYLGRVLRQLDPSQAVPARVRTALDTLAEGLLIIDRRQHIVLANSAFAAVVGEQHDRLVGRHVRDLGWLGVDSAPLAADAHPWRQSLVSGQHVNQVMVNFRDAGGCLRTFMANCSPILGGRSKPNGVLISLDDVTQLEEKKVELAKARDEAESANRAKSAFLANMSHEIRTPMNAILGFTELLRRGQGIDEPNARKYLGTIHSSGKHLLDLINDILDLSKVEAGGLDVEHVACAPCDIVREVLDILVVRAQEKNIALAFEPLGELPQSIRSDPARLRQIATNLIGNAIKFTDRGEVRVTMKLVTEGEFPMLVVGVRDTGIGIGADKLERIFDPFVQADASVSRRFGGTGLGLSISRRFARALGGDIRVTSKAGEGSLFELSVPVGSLAGVTMVEAEATMARVTASVAPGADRKWVFPRRRVLVVDDGPENRELVRVVLEECGLQIEEADDGLMGMGMALAGDFDAVLMDIQMPRMDGLTATRHLRQQGYRRPVVALTAHAMKGFEEEIKQAGYDHWLVKPIDIEGMLATLAQVLGGERKDASTATENVPEARDAPAVPVGAPIVSRYADKPRLHAAVRKFAERLPAQLTALAAAYEASDFEAIATLAHGLKGAGGTVGFDEFTEPAIEIERAARAGLKAPIGPALEKVQDLAARIVVPGEPAATSTRAAA